MPEYKVEDDYWVKDQLMLLIVHVTVFTLLGRGLGDEAVDLFSCDTEHFANQVTDLARNMGGLTFAQMLVVLSVNLESDLT